MNDLACRRSEAERWCGLEGRSARGYLMAKTRATGPQKGNQDSSSIDDSLTERYLLARRISTP